MKKLLHTLFRSATSVQRTSSLLLLVFIGFLSFGLSLNTCAQGPGSAWQYYRVITLNPATLSANFQVKITLVVGQYSNINADGSDLRFYDNSDVNSPYWIEVWSNTGTSIIWVKVATSGATSLRMYYGNAAASAETNGASTFDFFDDFPGTSLGTNWYSDASGGSISVSGGQVTLSNTNGGNVSISSAYTPASTAFLLETKHREPYYNRNRFYAATTLNGSTPPGLLSTWNDYGYFSSSGGAQNTAQCYWNGSWYTTVTRNTDYLTRWLLSDGSTYNWYTLTYSNNTIIDTRTTTYGTNIRYITIAVTEVSGTSTIVDWVRVRKYAASEPVAVVLSEVGSTTQMTAYSTSTIFTVPGCVSSITVEVWGGGGGGGTSTSNSRGGGGGGAYATKVLNVGTGSSYTVTVGTGGIPGNNGTDSWFNTNSLTDVNSVVADGGYTGTNSGGAGGTAANSNGTIERAGGEGGDQDPDTGYNNSAGDGGGGGGGQAGCNGANGRNGLIGGETNGGLGGGQPGNTGTCGTVNAGGNGGGDLGDGVDNDGNNGIVPGGGGGGCGDNSGSGTNGTSGSGADGLVIITWTYATAPTFTVSKTDISCFNAGDGTITVSASGGSGGYQYRINGGSGWIGWQSSNVFQNLGPGTYTVEVKDSNGCVQTVCN